MSVPHKMRGRPPFEVADNRAARAFAAFAETCRVDRGSAIPLWVQLKTCLEDAIHTGALARGARLPSLGVSNPAAFAPAAKTR